jgi:sugar transferase (PEP-CTERM system associated)
MIRLFNQYFPIPKILFFIGECLFVALAVVFSLVYHHVLNDYLQYPFLFVIKLTIVVLVYQVSLFFSDFYSIGTSWNFIKSIFRLIISLCIAFCIVPVAYALTPLTLFETNILITIAFFTLIFLAPWRLLYSWFINSNKYKKRTLILGSDTLAKNIAREIICDTDLSLNIIGFIAEDPQLQGVSLVNPKVIGNLKSLPAIVHKEGVNKIIVALEERRGNLPLDSLLRYKSNGIEIEDGADFYEKITNKLLIEHITPSHLIFCDGFELSFLSMLLKRTYDIAISLIGLVAISPIFLIISLLIKFESKGSVFFKQERVGKNEKLFNIYKFRSMSQDAEFNTGPIMSFRGDSRVTIFGKILRKTRLDELPQLWNILKGDMSFVGPRPERPVFVERFKKQIPFYTCRFSLRPGLTGWAQIRYPYATSIEDTLEKLRYELYYLKNFSPLFDFTIILRTIKVVLFANGSS